MSFRNKYLKYKEKYLNLKNLIGGANFGSDSAAGGGGGAAPPVRPTPEMPHREITPDYLESNIPDPNPGSQFSVIITDINNQEELTRYIKNFNRERNGFNCLSTGTDGNRYIVKFTRTIIHKDLNDFMYSDELLPESRASLTDRIKIQLSKDEPLLTKPIAINKRIQAMIQDEYIEPELNKYKSGRMRDRRQINYGVLTAFVPPNKNDTIKYNISSFHGIPIDYTFLKNYIDQLNDSVFDIMGHVEEDTTKVQFTRIVPKVDFTMVNEEFIGHLFNMSGKSLDDDIRLNIETINGIKVANPADLVPYINELNRQLNTFSGSLTQYGKVKFTYKFPQEVDWTMISDEYLDTCLQQTNDSSCRLNISTNNRRLINNAELIELVANFNTISRYFSGSVLDNNRVKFTMRLLEIDWAQITEQFLNLNLSNLYSQIRANIPRYTRPDGTVQVLDTQSLVELVSTFNASQRKYSASVTNGTKVKFSPRLVDIDFATVYNMLPNVIQKEGDSYRMIITLNNGVPIDDGELERLIYLNNLASGSIKGQRLMGNGKYIFTFKPQASNITKEEIQRVIDNIRLLKDFHLLRTDKERDEQNAITTAIQQVFDKLNNLQVIRFSKIYNGDKLSTSQADRDKMIGKLNRLLENGPFPK